MAPRLFGTGYYGNGAAMRVAPVGGYFCLDLRQAAQEARLSAVVTHTHPQGQAGAIAVAVAAAIAANAPYPTGQREVLPYVPESTVRERIQRSMDIPPDALGDAAARLGTRAPGQRPRYCPLLSVERSAPFGRFCRCFMVDGPGAG